ncbi:Uncharacterized protein Adt_34640 [Abeliophyllum distichum]|uniref:Uncharacterized protein n=1 Tax=Abeliophyllum distichum TaxID=126358 RepID=A0ABD1PNM0_9LAMI
MGDDRKRKSSEGSDESINWSDFPFLMKQVSGAFPGNVEVYKEGLKGLGADILKGLNEKWMMLEMEEAEIIGHGGFSPVEGRAGEETERWRREIERRGMIWFLV